MQRFYDQEHCAGRNDCFGGMHSLDISVSAYPLVERFGIMRTMSTSIENKNVLVVGGGTGIGLGIAQALALEKANVVIAGRRQAVLESAIEGTEMVARVCDASDREQANSLLSWFEDTIGRIDILAYCAGINVTQRAFEDMDPEDFDRIIQINLTGAFNFLFPVLKKMRAQKDGLIFNVTSIAALRPTPIAGVQYGASKVAQNWLGEFANLEGLSDGVRLTNILPGETNTPILDQRPKPPSDSERQNMVQPEDIGKLVLAIAQLPKQVVVPELVIKPAL